MAFFVGVDEAGLGPNLGPLVVSATAWHVPGAGIDVDLYRRLEDFVCGCPPPRGDARLAIADSKALYKQPGNLAMLERGVLAALSAVGEAPCAWDEAWRILDSRSAAGLGRAPWHKGLNPTLPLASDPGELAASALRLRKGLRGAGVSLVSIQSAALFPQRFNRWTERVGNKAEVLSRLTLRLVRRLLNRCAGEPTSVVCDKHGGRNHYGRLLHLAFPEQLVERRIESAGESVYRWGPADRRVTIGFRVGGEAFLPHGFGFDDLQVHARLAMRALNQFWQRHVADLRPTAGYPLDARRFKAAIGAAQTKLGISDRELWREMSRRRSARGTMAQVRPCTCTAR